MQKRVCKNGGLELSVLGLGCWSFGGGDYWGERSQKEVETIVKTSIDLGINYFDTAELYNEGRSEESLGQALKGVPREQVIVGSKISPANCQPDVLVKHCEASLQRLQMDYIDLYMIHWPIHPYSIASFTNDEDRIKNPPEIAAVFAALLQLREAGKIRHIGVSNFGVPKLEELPTLEHITANQLPYSLLSRAIEFDVLGHCQQNGIGTIGYMGLMQGLLADKYPTFDDIPPNRRRTRHFADDRTAACRHGEPGFEAETRQALAAIRKISKEAGIPMADLAFKWVVANQLMTCNLFGVSTAQQVRANVEAIEEPLAPDLVEALNEATQPLKQALGNHIDLFEGAANDRTI